jgi:hypothetical protein
MFQSRCNETQNEGLMRRWAYMLILGLILGSCSSSGYGNIPATTTRPALSPPAATRGLIRVVIEDPPRGFPPALKAPAQCENGPFQGMDAGRVVAGEIGEKYRVTVDAVDPEFYRDLTIPPQPGATVVTPRNHPNHWLENREASPTIRSTTKDGRRGTMIVTYEVKKGDFPDGESVQHTTGARMAFSWWCSRIVTREPG